MQKETVIVPPDGYEVDEENSTLECIKFKKIGNPPLKITEFELGYHKECKINGRWAFTVYEEEADDMLEKAGHKAIIYLPNCNGQWYDEKGNPLQGGLHYKPKTDK